MGKSVEELMAELESEGVKPSSAFNNNKVGMPEDNDLKVILDMQRITGVNYSDEQKDILKHKGNACILACAGSGKTTLSVHLIAKRIMTGEIVDSDKLIYTTYSKAGATEMKERLDKVLKQLGINKQVQVRTLHSFFLQVLRIFGIQADIISNEQRRSYVRSACKESGYEAKDDDLMLIDNLLSYQVNNLLNDKKTIECYVNTLEDLTLEQYSLIRKGYASRKLEAGVIDYDDMQSYLYLWLHKYARSKEPTYVELSKQVREYCQACWTDFYIDEAQDVSKIQFAIIRGMITNPDEPNKLLRNLVFIGDDDQCIYTWRGSDPSIILSIGPLFDMRTFVLSTNYRCKSEIVDYATLGVKCNHNRFDKTMNANIEGGTVKIVPSIKEDLCSVSIIALNHIKYLISRGEKLDNIAVLSRNNMHLAILSNMLLREGIYCTMTDDMKLTKSAMYSDMKVLVEFCKPCWNVNYTRQVLWKLCRFIGRINANMIAEFQDTSSLTLEDTLGWIIKHFINKDLDFNKKLSVGMQAEEKIRYYIGKMSNDSLADLQALYMALANTDKGEALKIMMYLYKEATINFLYKSDDKIRTIRGLTTYFNNLIIKDGYEKMCDFLRVTEQFENGRFGITGDTITLSTIHSAKGREWKNVIMFACDNVTIPSFDGLNKMLKDGIATEDLYENLDEERRLFYVGNTRAKENLLIITYMKPSVFILEALGADGLDSKYNDETILEYVQDKTMLDMYNDFVKEKLLSTESKYYYNPDEHRVEQ